MGQHHRAKLGPAGRAQLVSVINAGATFRAAAAAMNVAPATAHRWWWRWQHAPEPDRCSGRWAQDRSSRPYRSAGQTSPERERRILELRFGFEGEPWTLEAIGNELDLTRERVRQLEGQALARLGALRDLISVAAA